MPCLAACCRVPSACGQQVVFIASVHTYCDALCHHAAQACSLRHPRLEAVVYLPQEVILDHILDSTCLALTQIRRIPDPAHLTLTLTLRLDPDFSSDAQSVLPLSNAFATTGITAAFILLAIVMSANCWTAHMLIWQVSPWRTHAALVDGPRRTRHGLVMVAQQDRGSQEGRSVARQTTALSAELCATDRPVHLERYTDEHCMLPWQSYKVGTVDYESLGYAIGGPFWKVPFLGHCCPWLRKKILSLQCVLLLERSTSSERFGPCS